MKWVPSQRLGTRKPTEAGFACVAASDFNRQVSITRYLFIQLSGIS